MLYYRQHISLFLILLTLRVRCSVDKKVKHNLGHFFKSPFEDKDGVSTVSSLVINLQNLTFFSCN